MHRNSRWAAKALTRNVATGTTTLPASTNLAASYRMASSGMLNLRTNAGRVETTSARPRTVINELTTRATITVAAPVGAASPEPVGRRSWF